MNAMRQDGKCAVDIIRVDGGLTRNDFFCQFLSDILGLKVELPQTPETTAFGAACLAAIGAGIFKNVDDVAATWKKSKGFNPQMAEADSEKLYKGWEDCITHLIKD